MDNIINFEDKEYQEIIKRVNGIEINNNSEGINNNSEEKRNTKSNEKTKIYCFIQQIELFNKLIDSMEISNILNKTRNDIVKILGKM